VRDRGRPRQFGPAKQGLFRVRVNAIKLYIPRIWRDFLDLLTRKRNAHELRMKPVTTMSQERESTIEVATAHADAVRFPVERDSRRDDKIEIARVDSFTVNGLPDIEHAALQKRMRRQPEKGQLATVAQNRNENALVRSPGAVDNARGFDFFIHRQVAGDIPGCKKLPRGNDAATYDSGCGRAIFRAHASPGRQPFVA